VEECEALGVGSDGVEDMCSEEAVDTQLGDIAAAEALEAGAYIRPLLRPA
jgi:hypothetical protein